MSIKRIAPKKYKTFCNQLNADQSSKLDTFGIRFFSLFKNAQQSNWEMAVVLGTSWLPLLSAMVNMQTLAAKYEESQRFGDH